MKSLTQFIKEHQSKLYESDESTTITLDLAELENAEETLKSLGEKEGCSVDGEKVTVTVSKDDIDKAESVKDALQKYVETLKGSTKRSSDEQYAQKIKAFEDKVSELASKIDEIKNPSEEE